LTTKGWIVCALTMLLLLLILSACEPLEPQQGVGAREGAWTLKAMESGPSLYWTCLNGDRIYALSHLHSRGKAGLWPGASIAAVKGGCNRG
jgi:hypothetical protein